MFETFSELITYVEQEANKRFQEWLKEKECEKPTEVSSHGI